ncbi:hypothetical protein D3C87_1864080 [compost metagenome]
MTDNAQWRGSVGVKAFAVDTVDAIDLDAACLDLFLHGVDHAPVLEIIEMCRPGREKYHRNALAAKDEYFHKSIQSRAKPFVISPFHEKRIV